jgi:hypothetical protein
VLSPTHLHEFKSADHIYSQSPVMSLLLTDQKLGSHSQPGSSSHKFMLKGRQTGSMHRGHSWVFRAETYDTMLAWYDDIRALTEKTGEERNAFVRKHARSFSAGSHRASSISGDSALDEDEADEVPFSAAASQANVDGVASQDQAKRPEPGGRFPSDLNVRRRSDLLGRVSDSSGSGSEERQRQADGSEQPLQQDISSMAGGLQTQPHDQVQDGGAFPFVVPLAAGPETVKRERGLETDPAAYQQSTTTAQLPPQPPPTQPQYQPSTFAPPAQASALPPSQDPFLADPHAQPHTANLVRHDSNYADWMAPAAGGAALGAAGAVGAEHFWRKKRDEAEARQADTLKEVDVADTASSPTATAGVLPLPPVSTTQAPPVASAASPTDPIITTPITLATATSGTGAASILSQSTAATDLTESPVASHVDLVGTTGEGHTKYDTNPDGTVNAVNTGRVWPILRHNTDVSVSNLHVPGEFPKSASS